MRPIQAIHGWSRPGNAGAVPRMSGSLARVALLVPALVLPGLLLGVVPGSVLAQAALPTSEVVPHVAGEPLLDGEPVPEEGAGPLVEMQLADGTRVVAYEWVMLVDPEQRQILAAQAPTLMRYLRTSRRFSLVSGELLTFSIPPDLDENEAVLQLVPESLRDRFDRNHVFVPRSRKSERDAATPLIREPGLELRQPFAPVCEQAVTMGMVDSWIDAGHPAFSHFPNPDRVLLNRNFVEAGLPQAKAHGTAVAALFAGEHQDKGRQLLSPLLPEVRLLNAAVFHAVDGNEEGAPVSRILAGLDWLAQQEGIEVINMSIAGPLNRVLAHVVSALAAQQVLIVAAVGNDGPFGPARYPAAYEAVVGVTATRPNGEVYRWSNQGEHVDFAALGAGVVSAGAEHAFAEQSGTSLAAPVVAAYLACHMARGLSADDAIAALAAKAVDLGVPGRDSIYGHGLLHP